MWSGGGKGIIILFELLKTKRAWFGRLVWVGLWSILTWFRWRVWAWNMVAGLDDKIACADNGLCHQPLPEIEKCWGEAFEMVKMWRMEEFVKLRRRFRWQQCVCAITLLVACLTYIPPHRAPRTHSGWRWCGSGWVEHSYLFVCLLVYQPSSKKMGYGSIMGSPWSKKITSKLCSLIRFYEKFTVRTVDLKRPKDDSRSKL